MIAQHREDRYGGPELAHRAVVPGPIALQPAQPEHLVAAVVAAGGEVAQLSPETKGLIWSSERHAEELWEVLRAHPGISWVQLPWAGVDAFGGVFSWIASIPEGQRPVVTSAKGAYAEPVAEHALALLLACMREIPQKARAARWQPVRTGLSLFGRHVVVVGAGGVGLAIVDLLQPFRAEVTVVRRDASRAVPGATRVVSTEDLSSQLASADAVVLAAAHTHATTQLLGIAEFEKMPAHAVVVNIARGPLIDTDALVEALREGQILCAGLDVTDPEPLPDGHPLFSLPNCVVTSHSADTPAMSQPLLASRVVHNVRAFLTGSPFRGVVGVAQGY